jgi:hypothetical protein
LREDLDIAECALVAILDPPLEGEVRSGPRKPTLDEMGPGIEAIPARKPGSTLGRPGMRGGFKRKGR